MNRTLIYHSIGTLTPDHFRWSMESLNNQNIHWEDFVLYNHSDRSDDMVLYWLDKTQYDNITVFDRKNNIKGAIADWDEQFRRIGNADIYFVHKADFYLADGALKRFEKICNIDTPMFVGVKKFDMEETAEIELIRGMAKLESFESGKQIDIAHPYDPSEEPKWDGVMHGYNDPARSLLKPYKEEIRKNFGACNFIDNSKINKIVDDQIYAMHMFHELPYVERLPEKQIMGRRY